MKLPKEIVSIALIVTMFGIIAVMIGMTKPKEVKVNEIVYPQCDNSNVAPWK